METKTNYRRVFTREQKIVASVWYHERHYTGMTYEQLAYNFLIRFKIECPGFKTLYDWEKKLFKKRTKNSKSRSLTRLIYIPYVKESLVKFPALSMKARSQLLGISYGSLKSIFQFDLTSSDLELLKNKQVSKETTQKNKDESTLKGTEEYHTENKNENAA